MLRDIRLAERTGDGGIIILRGDRFVAHRSGFGAAGPADNKRRTQAALVQRAFGRAKRDVARRRLVARLGARKINPAVVTSE